MIPVSLKSLIDWLGTFPGIGPRSALRMALYLVDFPKDRLNQFVSILQTANQTIHPCSICRSYAEENPCQVCRSPFSESGILCIIETFMDVLALKNSLPDGAKFHVLEGKLSPMNGISPLDLNLENLEKRFKQTGLKEIILATGPDLEGEATASYIRALIPPTLSVKITRIAFGVSAGITSIGTADESSIQRSLSARISY